MLTKVQRVAIERMGVRGKPNAAAFKSNRFIVVWRKKAPTRKGSTQVLGRISTQGLQSQVLSRLVDASTTTDATNQSDLFQNWAALDIAKERTISACTTGGMLVATRCQPTQTVTVAHIRHVDCWLAFSRCQIANCHEKFTVARASDSMDQAIAFNSSFHHSLYKRGMCRRVRHPPANFPRAKRTALSTRHWEPSLPS